jgi:bifunctional N-acetylglucosamine-1-phosphate-uridyltransferase/glucosamine-1-phosphate-acetyltransferase GlmU-like protein
MNTDLDIIILAAGLGTRMKSNLAKVLHKLDGRPLISHVCETALSLGPRKIYIIVGHQAEDVKAAALSEIEERSVSFALQEKQLGTGDAVNAARKYLEDERSTVLVLSGDVPMIRAETAGSDHIACGIRWSWRSLYRPDRTIERPQRLWPRRSRRKWWIRTDR